MRVMRVVLPLVVVVALVAFTVVILVLPHNAPLETPDSGPSAATTRAPEDEPGPLRTDVPSPAETLPTAPVETRPAAAAPVEEPKNSVWGVVKTEAGAPIEGAQVRLKTLRVFGLGGKTDVDREAVSDTDGRFRFADLPDEERALFSLTASHPSYATLHITKMGYGTCSLTLDLPGVVRGRVVYEGTDEPCSGATVSLYNARGGSGHAKTDENGAYRIGALPPGAYHATIQVGRHVLANENVAVEANAGTEANFQVKRTASIHGIVRDAATEAPVRGAIITVHLGLGESVAVGPDGRFTYPDIGHGRFRVNAPGYVAEMTLLKELTGTSPERPHVVHLKRGAVIEGVLEQEGGGALPEDVRVVAEKEGERRHMILRPNIPAEVAKDGRFRIDGVPVGAPVRVIAMQVLRRLAASALLTLNAGETRRDVRLTLPATGSITGRVTGPDGHPIAGVTVSIRPSEETPPVPIARQTTDPDGRYTLERVPPGRHTIRVWTKQFAYAAREFVLAKPESVTGVNIQLSFGLSIGGVVRDTNGNPVAGVSVNASPTSSVIAAAKGAATDKSGRFTVNNLTAGTYRITCFSPDHRPRKTEGAVFADAGTADVVLVLEAFAGPVTGVVRDRATGAPVRRFLVWMVSDHGTFEQRFSDREGRFRLRASLAGRRSLRATTEDGRVSEVVSVELTPGGTPPPVELWLARGTSIEGRVLAPDGSPLERAGVEVVRTASPRGTVGRATTDRDGRFRCTGLRREHVVVRASHPEWVEVEKEVTPGNEPPKVELRLTADGATVTVTVVDGVGKPVAAAPVRFSREGRLVQPSLYKEAPPRGESVTEARRGLYQTDEDGRHVRRFLPRGRYTIEVNIPEGRGSVAVDVETGAARAVTLRLAPRE